MSDGDLVVVIHSTWRGRLTAYLGPLVVLGLGVYGLVAGSPNPINVTLAVVGGLLSAISVFDFPLQARFGRGGVERVALLRRHTLAWADVSAVRRAAARAILGGSTGGTGALVAQAGRRHYLLCDVAESEYEHAAIERAMAGWPDSAAFAASPPAEGRPPTWLHKRRPGDGLVDERVGE